MSTMQPFEWDGLRVRALADEHGEPWFVARDVCAALCIVNSRDAVARLADDERGVGTADTPGGAQEVVTVSEAGLYRLIFTSRRPEAESFKRWVTHDVLPAIRRAGSYALPQREPTRLELIEGWRDAELRAIAAEAATQALLPSATAWDHLADAQGDWSLREAAQVLSRDLGIDTGQNRLAETLREIGWTDRKSIPFQRHVDGGRLVQRATTYTHPRTGDRVAATQLRITPKGLGRLRELLAPGGVVVADGVQQLTVVPS